MGGPREPSDRGGHARGPLPADRDQTRLNRWLASQAAAAADMKRLEEHTAVELFCDCTEGERVMSGVDEEGECVNCGHTRREKTGAGV